MSAAELHDAKAVLATWGRSVRFKQENGRVRTLTAVIDNDGEADFNETTRRLSSREQISAFVLRDKDNATYGGIDAANLGDVLTINPGEENERSYSFSGQKTGGDEESWTLQFAFTSTYQIGGNRIR